MKRILLVKTSSLGDVVHNLPVASDIRAALPAAEIDWVVEEALAGIPRLHTAVARVLPVATRRWRTGLLGAATRAEIRAFLSELRRCPYDAVIDTQGLLKSAWIAWAAHGPSHGLDFASAREPLSLFYDRTYSVPWTKHAVERNRDLASNALGYVASASVDYGLRRPAATPAWLPPGNYVVLAHGTSAPAKLWPVASWIEFGARLAQRGLPSVLPWGTVAERARAEEIARGVTGAAVAPGLSIADAAAVLGGARAVIGVDTGLVHLAGALAVPTLGLYCATDPAATGLYGCARAVNLGGVGSQPEVTDVIAALDRLLPGLSNHESRITNHE
jgi:heptosyltransferase-1